MQTRSLHAEDAAGTINSLLSEHRSIAKPHGNAPSRGVVRTATANYLADPGVAIALIIAVTESFLADELDQQTSARMATVPPFVASSWTRHQSERAESSWQQLKDAWTEWHDIPVGTAPAWDPVRSFVEARNSVMHGQGRLTRRQMRKDLGRSTRNRLAKVLIDVDSTNRLELDQGHVDDCAQICRELIHWLDDHIA